MRIYSLPAIFCSCLFLAGCSTHIATKASPTIPWELRDDDNDRVRNEVDKCPDSLPGQIIVAGGCPQPPHGPRSDVNFDSNSDVLRPDAIAILDMNIEILMSKSGDAINIDVVGHSDACGSSEQKQLISDRRAMRVKSYLLSNGVPATRIRRTYGVSDTEPVVRMPAENCSQESNRSVVLRAVQKHH